MNSKSSRLVDKCLRQESVETEDSPKNKKKKIHTDEAIVLYKTSEFHCRLQVIPLPQHQIHRGVVGYFGGLFQFQAAEIEKKKIKKKKKNQRVQNMCVISTLV